MAVRIKLNRKTVADLLKSPEMAAILAEHGSRIAAAAGDGVEVEQFIGRTRARVTVRTATTEAMLNEARDRTLTRAIDAGRG